jgi:low affinity Fe/Cu permease
VILVVLWAPSIFVIRSIDTWQLIINTVTTIVTFLLVALLQNSETRSDRAVQHKLNAIADGIADLMDHLAERSDDEDLRRDIRELRVAVGLEKRETTGDEEKGQRT